MKLYIPIIVLIIIAVGGFFLINKKDTVETYRAPDQPAIITSTTTTTTTTVATTTIPATTTATTKPAPAPTPKPVITPTPTVTTYTLASISSHNSKTSCWTAVNGEVYDITAYVPRHPGGEKQILTVCGKDGSSLFEDQHGGDSKPNKVLASYRIGPLSN